MKTLWSTIKTHSTTILLVVLTVLVLCIAVLTFWLKIRGFKISDLLLRLQVVEAENQIGHLQTKKAVLIEKEDTSTESISQLESKIKEEKKKLEKTKMEIEGLSNEEIARRLTDLGF